MNETCKSETEIGLGTIQEPTAEGRLQGFRLSLQQRRSWEAGGRQGTFHARCVVELQGELDTKSLRRALTWVVAKHEILRTAFSGLSMMKVPVQVVEAEVTATLRQVDLGKLTPRECQEELRRRAEEPFDLERAPLLRAVLAATAPRRHLLLLALPALCADERTLAGLVGEFVRAYGECVAGSGDLASDKEALQYRHFSEMQQKLLEEGAEVRREFWRRQRLEAQPPLRLPSIRSVDRPSKYRPEVAWVELEQAAVERAAAQLGSSHALFLLACWQVLLWRFARRSPTVVAVTVEGRWVGELEDVLGPLAQPLPLALNLSAERGFQGVVKELEEHLQEAAEHQEYEPSSEALGEVASDPFAIGFECVEIPVAESVAGVRFTVREKDVCAERSELRLRCVTGQCVTGPGGGGKPLGLELRFDPELYAAADVERLAKCLKTLVASAARRPEAPVGDLEIVDAEVRSRLLEASRGPALEIEPDISVERLFERRAAEYAERIAVIWEDEGLSYGELDARADQLARFLRARQVGPEVPVPIYLRRSPAVLVAILGVLKAGGAFAPLAPGQPQSRLASMLQQLDSPVVLTERGMAADLPEAGEGELERVMIDEDWPTIAGLRIADQRNGELAPTAGAHLAYVIFTSGSTGQPKGVMVERRQLLSYLRAVLGRLSPPAAASYAAVSTFAADLGHTMIFPALCTGGCLHVISRECATDPLAFAEYFDRHRIDCLKITPSHLEALRSHPQPERMVPRSRLVLGGEAARPAMVTEIARAAPQGCEIFNHYGPTETTVGVLTYRVGERPFDERSRSLPLGRPLAGSRVYLLDERLRPVPPWVAGEAHVGGANLSRGYLSHPARTAGNFIPDPFGDVLGGRLYRTGDLVRQLPGGELEFLGRRDSQVKFNGFRVELDEIRRALVRDPRIHESVVRLAADRPGRNLLVAYYVGHEELPAVELRSLVADTLPEEILPNLFVHLSKFPYNRNGKIDVAALPGVDEVLADGGATYVAPGTANEAVLAELWADLLGLERVSVDASFFDLGGHSLLATRLIAGVRERLGVAVPLHRFLKRPTVAGLMVTVARIKAGEGGGGAPEELPRIVPCPDECSEVFPLNEVQQAYWIGRMGAFELGNIATHSYFEFERDGLDIERFEDALQTLIRRHDMLRAVVLPDGSQRVLPQVPHYRVSVLDLRGRPSAEAEAELEELRREMAERVFDPEQWPMFDFRVTRLDGGQYRIHASRDAIIFDAWSAGILFDEWAKLYEAPGLELPECELRFRDYVLAERELRDSEDYRRAWAYWQPRLPDLAPAPELPLVQDPARLQRPRFVHLSASLSSERWRRLKQRAASAGLTPSGLVVAAFAEILGRWSKNPRFTLNLTLFHRLPLHPEVQDVIGDFTSMTLLETDPVAGSTFEVRARRLQEQLWQDLEHRHVSGLRVLRELALIQRRPPGALIPVVLTSLLSLEDPERDRRRREFLGERITYAAITSQTWLDHVVVEEEGALRLYWNAVEDLFPTKMLDDAFDTYQRLLERLADREESWSEVPHGLLPPEQLRRRREINTTGVAPPSEKRLHTLFQRRAEECSGAPAVVAPSRTLSYGELDRRSRRLGAELRAAGVGRGQLVAVVMEKGWEQVVAVLGILDAGAAYLPIDAGLPPSRIRHLLARGEVARATTQPWVEERLEWPEGVRRHLVLAEDKVLAEDEGLPADRSTGGAVQGTLDLAYVIFTSGSSGEPKGVMIDHRGAVNTVLDVNRRFAVGPADRVLGLSSLSFDLSVWDIFGPLAAGGALVLPEPSANRDPERWRELIKVHQVTIWNSVPALKEMLIEHAANDRLRPHPDLRSLRLVMMSGDWIPVTLPDRIRELIEDVVVISMGGATEASIWSILYPIGEVEPTWSSIPYGKPMTHQSFHVLDVELEPRPIWVPGRLYIGGIGVARGYWRDEEKSRASFFDHPRSGERLYQTGDLGRYLPDGNIEFLGRDDLQVKISGHRVELGEVEAALVEYPGVQAAVAVACGERSRQRLVAYVVSARGGDDQPQRLSPPRLYDSQERLAFRLRQVGRRRFSGPPTTEPLAAPELAGEQLRPYHERRSHRTFSPRPVALGKLELVLSALRQLRLEDQPVAKYRYPSAGHLYSVQVYLHVKSGRVDGLDGGNYYYDPAGHRLVRLSETVLGRQLLAAGNGPVFEGAAGSVFLAAPEDMVASVYGERAHAFCLLEAGYLSQLMITEGPAAGLGFCPIGSIDDGPLISAFDLGPGHAVLHALLWGAVPEAESAAFDALNPPVPAVEERFLPTVQRVRTIAGAGDPTRGLALKLRQPGLRRFPPGSTAVALGPGAEGETPAALSLELYERRRSHRHFLDGAVSAEDLGRMLACLRSWQPAAAALPKYRYPSVGHLYPVQCYLYLAPGRVSGISPGTYYYDPQGHRLVTLSPRARLGPELVTPSNRGIFEGASFGLFLVADLDAIEPAYGPLAEDFCFLEAGYLGQLLMTEAPAEGIGLCPVGSARPESLEAPLELDRGRHRMLHAFLGGAIDSAELRLQAWIREPFAAAPEPRISVAAEATVIDAEDLSPRLRTEDLRLFLEGRLPNYMVPSTFVELESLPLSANGKVDRQALPDPGEALEEAPRTKAAERKRTFTGETEELLASVWAEMMELERVAVNDDFFKLGGHSLLAIRIISRVRQLFKVEVPLSHFFKEPTVAKLARVVEEAQRQGSGLAAPPIERRGPECPPVLSFTQERQWLLAQIDPETSIYNHPSASRLIGELDVPALERAVNEIVRRHEILRTTYAALDGRLEQRIAPPSSVSLPRLDLAALSPERREAELLRRVAEGSRQPFDLERGPVWRGWLLRLAPAEHLLLFSLHHVAADHWSGGVLMRELGELYDAFRHRRRPRLAELPVQFSDFAAWQRRWFSGEVLEVHLAYWRRQLEGAPELLELPTDRPRPPAQTFVGQRAPLIFPESLTASLKNLARRREVTPFMVLLSGFQILLHHLSGQREVVVGAPEAGRDRPELEGLIGCFINALAVRLDLGGDPTFAELLERVRATTLSAYAHRELPFEKLVEELRPRREPAYTPIFQVVFNFQSASAAPPSLLGLEVRTLQIDTGRSKYDLTLYLGERENRIQGAIEYNVGLFDRRTVDGMVRNLVELLEKTVADPEIRLSDLRHHLTEREREHEEMKLKELDQSKLKKLRKVRRRAVNVSQDERINTRIFADDQPLPLAVEPKVGEEV